MGWTMKDFVCPVCGVTEKFVERGVSQLICCGTTAKSLISAPRIVGADSFNPHFDITQGQFFGTSDEKRNWLKGKDKEQVDGTSSPRLSGGGRVICSRNQAKQFKRRRVRNSEIPGLRSREHISVPVSRV